MCCVRLPRQQLVRKLLHGIGDRFDRQHELARKFLDISVEALLELQYTTPLVIGIIKDAVDAVPPAWLMGMRFVATAAILAVVFHKTLRANLDTSHLFAGVVLGVLSFLGFWIQTIGITDTTPGRNAFLTATYCVMVPFLYWIVAKRRPTVLTW